MKHYNWKPISTDNMFIGINFDILNITIKKCKLHILPSLRLTYNTCYNHVIFDLDWLMFELRLYVLYKHIKNKWRE